MSKIYNIDYLRFILAFLVLFQHSFELGGWSYPYLHTLYGSKFAVDSFFILSGFLIYQSYEKNPSLKKYFIKRFFRIYPAYLFSILFFSAVIFLLFRNINVASLLRYIVFQIPFTNSVQPTIDGVFINNKISAVNGALWTLKVEIIFYACVPIIYYIASKIKLRTTIILLYIFSVAWTLGLEQLRNYYKVPEFLFHQFPTQLKYFAAGIFMYYISKNQKFKNVDSKYLLMAFGIYLLGGLTVEENVVLRPLFIGGLIYSIIFYKNQLNKLSFDFSYGLYVVHFPLLQLLYSFYNFSWGITFFCSVILAILLAAFIWFNIEKPFIKKAHTY